jgi:hypothetical protein
VKTPATMSGGRALQRLNSTVPSKGGISHPKWSLGAPVASGLPNQRSQSAQYWLTEVLVDHMTLFRCVQI